jgi:hypothetical protein
VIDLGQIEIVEVEVVTIGETGAGTLAHCAKCGFPFKGPRTRGLHDWLGMVLRRCPQPAYLLSDPISCYQSSVQMLWALALLRDASDLRQPEPLQLDETEVDLPDGVGHLAALLRLLRIHSPSGG